LYANDLLRKIKESGQVQAGRKLWRLVFYFVFVMTVGWLFKGSNIVDVGPLGCNFMWLKCSLEEGGSVSLLNVGIYLQVHMALEPRRQSSPSSIT
jgi:hypothetical protein